MPCFLFFFWFPKPGEEFTLFPVSFYFIHWAFGWGMEDGGAPIPWQLVSFMHATPSRFSVLSLIRHFCFCHGGDIRLCYIGLVIRFGGHGVPGRVDKTRGM